MNNNPKFDQLHLPANWTTDQTLLDIIPAEDLPQTMKRLPESDDYAISVTLAQVYSIKRKKYLRAKINPQGYLVINIFHPFKRNKKQGLRIHRLVCRAAHGECPKKADAGHIHPDKTLNHWANLTWQSRSDNVRESIARNSRNGINNPKAKGRGITPDKIETLCLEFWTNRTKQSKEIISELASKHNLNPKTIKSIVTGKNHTEIVYSIARRYGYKHLFDL